MLQRQVGEQHVKECQLTWQEAKSHINILELKAALLAIRTYVPIWEPVAIHLQLDNTTALAYLMKMGGTRNLNLINLSQEIWNYLLNRQITITFDSGQGVSSDERFQRVEIEQENFSQDCLMFQVAGDRSVRVNSVASASSLHFLETGPIQSQSGCLSKHMEIV